MNANISGGMKSIKTGVSDIWARSAANVQQKGFLQSGADAGKSALNWAGDNKLKAAGLAIGALATVSVMRSIHRDNLYQQQQARQQQGPSVG